MSLPPGFLDELRSRASLSQVVGRKVMWDPRKSNQGKGDMWAPCPFHQEKSASFHVDDRKGFYYCFGCHAKGDAISFVRETENVSFMEAVEILAREAGMPMPKQDPRAQEKADKRTQLAEVMELAVQYFRLQLRTAAAGAARDYLAGRGLTPQALEQWEIGFAPDQWQGLWDHLKAKNVEDALILGAGLAKPSSKGGRPYDTFRGRIMYPIRDARGRAIAFGGRAMDPNDNAKYLNSPETELFDKGRSLYNVRDARTAAGQGKPLIVAEGYMDVIALVQAGFGAAVEEKFRGWHTPDTIAAGASLITLATSRQVSSPGFTIVSTTTESAVCSPSMPGRALANSQHFSCVPCGAWSVATQSITPSARACRNATASLASRNGGLTRLTPS